MKHKLLHLQSLVVVALCVIMAMALASCSDDDDEPATYELTSIIVGTWAQDGDNDIFVVNANGTGVVYDSQILYEQKKDGNDFTWSYKNGWVYITVNHDSDDDFKLEMRAKLVSKDIIVWQSYEVPGEYDSSDEWDGHDAYGNYYFWTWERYSR